MKTVSQMTVGQTASTSVSRKLASQKLLSDAIIRQCMGVLGCTVNVVVCAWSRSNDSLFRLSLPRCAHQRRYQIFFLLSVVLWRAHISRRSFFGANIRCAAVLWLLVVLLIQFYSLFTQAITFYLIVTFASHTQRRSVASGHGCLFSDDMTTWLKVKNIPSFLFSLWSNIKKYLSFPWSFQKHW